jgi:hypothetical protein
MTNETSRSWRIIHGDCISEMARLLVGCVRLLFADPPYNLGIDYGNGTRADQLPKLHYISTGVANGYKPLTGFSPPTDLSGAAYAMNMPRIFTSCLKNVGFITAHG